MNEIDDSNLAICCSCGYVDDWVEIPGGQCSVSGEGLDYCPECGEVDNMADYTVERAAKIDAKKALERLNKAAEDNGEPL
jgi:hypothetical protein